MFPFALSGCECYPWISIVPRGIYDPSGIRSVLVDSVNRCGPSGSSAAARRDRRERYAQVGEVTGRRDGRVGLTTSGSHGLPLDMGRWHTHPSLAAVDSCGLTR